MSDNHQTRILAHLKQVKALAQGEAIHHFDQYHLRVVFKRLHNIGRDIVTHHEPNLSGKRPHALHELNEVRA